MPSVAAMNIPHVFHGIAGDETVPADSSALDKLLGCIPALRYAGANILPGIKMEIYCSGIVTLDSTQVTSVAMISPGPLLTIFVIPSIITAS